MSFGCPFNFVLRLPTFGGLVIAEKIFLSLSLSDVRKSFQAEIPPHFFEVFEEVFVFIVNDS